MNGEIWINKYQPERMSDIHGQTSAVKALWDFVQNFKKQKKKAMILYGPTGCGKTAAVQAIAHELDLELLEVNASDYRNAEQIDNIIGGAVAQQSLFFKQKLILFDEIDGLSGMKDRGGISSLKKLIDKTAFPIVCTANDPFNKKFSDLRKKSEMIQFNQLDYKDVFEVLKKISDKEGIKYQEDVLKTLARRVGGDLRAGINDLQTLTHKSGELTKGLVDELSERESKESILQALVKVFKTTDPSIAISAYNNVDEDYDKIRLWLDENLPKEYEKPADLARAYDYMSKADIFNRRIRRWQHWRFLVYINAFLSAGIAVSKDAKYPKFFTYQPTKRILKLWQANMKFAKRKTIAEKVALKTHTSTKRVVQDTIPYLQELFRKNKSEGEKLAEYFDLNSEEVAWLRK